MVAVPWCKNGRFLEERPSFTLDPHFHAGAYYVQEASSMFVEQALEQSIDLNQKLRVLDLCAAPGGKSTHILSLLSPESLLVANEAIGSRATILSENIQKWGYPNVIVTNDDPSAFKNIPGFFDVILIDAPCSGEGLFRKDQSAVAEWSADSVALCSLRQRRIVEDAWPALKSGGLLIYCTCTYNENENENNVQWIQSTHELEFVSLQAPFKGIQESVSGGVKGYRFFPHKTPGEGFFLSVLRKLEGQESVRPKVKNDQARKSISPKLLKGDFVSLQGADLTIAIPAAMSIEFQWLAQHLKVLLRGTAMGGYKHDKFIPDHASALSTNLDDSIFPIVDLTYDQAIQYLRKDTLEIEAPQKGYCLARFQGNALGWMNVLGNRINNLYPPAWRIRMQADSTRP